MFKTSFLKLKPNFTGSDANDVKDFFEFYSLQASEVQVPHGFRKEKNLNPFNSFLNGSLTLRIKFWRTIARTIYILEGSSSLQKYFLTIFLKMSFLCSFIRQNKFE